MYKIYEEKIINFSLYKMKCLVSIVLLIPVLLLQADEGEFLYKRDAIRRARELYKDKISFVAVDIATHIRNSWKVPGYVGNIRGWLALIDPFVPCLQNVQRVTGSTAFFSGSDAKEFIKEAKLFSSSVRDYICG